MLCTAVLRVVFGIRFVVAFSLQLLFAVALFAGMAWYVFEEMGVLCNVRH